jgi:hypothetical protein
MIKKILVGIILLFCSSVSAAPAPLPKEFREADYIGRWEYSWNGADKIYLHFFKDGYYSGVSEGVDPCIGRWKVVGPGELVTILNNDEDHYKWDLNQSRKWKLIGTWFRKGQEDSHDIVFYRIIPKH